MDQARLIALSALSLVALAASGCPTGVVCTEEARASVQVTVVDAAGTDLNDADVSFSVDGGGTFDACDDVDTGAWVCGWEVDGAITIRAEAVGFITDEQTVTVASDECHVIGQTLQITLDQAPIAGQWQEGRAYYVQLISDAEECANSWELYSMNCYQMAWFCPSGEVEIILTDIINRGVYTIEDAALSVEFTQPGDVSSPWSFTIEDDAILVDQYGVTWQRDVDFDVIGAPYCDGGSQDPVSAQ